MICHGQGDPRADWQDGGCCFIAGEICPMRWAVDSAGDVWDSTRTNLGDLDALIRSVYGVNNPNTRDDIIEFLGWQAGTTMFVCTAFGAAAVAHWDEFMASQGQQIVMTDRVQADVRWSEEFDVGGSAEAVGDAWEAAGKPRNWCTTYGPTEQTGQCCHREDQATNDARAAGVSVTRVSVSSQAAGAS